MVFRKRMHCLDCLALKSIAIANSFQILHYIFYKFFIFSQWPLKFYIIKFNASLYRFLLKILQLVRKSVKIFVKSVVILYNCLCNSVTRQTQGKVALI